MSHAVRPANRSRAIRRLFLCFQLLSVLALLSPYPACAGEWRVTPIRVFFERGSRSGIVNVQNDGDSPMQFVVKAMEWTQDPDGKDLYLESNELVFFPKLLTVPPKAERVIRLGMKGGAGAREKTFRLFVEEAPKPAQEAKEAKSEGATVAVNVRFAIPVFVTPVSDQPGGKLAKTELLGGEVRVTVQNTGNVHFRLAALQARGKNAKGEETFSTKADGWYLLNGAARTFSVPVPEEACLLTETVEVEGVTDRKIVLGGSFPVDKKQCRP